jgi:adenosine deaminase
MAELGATGLAELHTHLGGSVATEIMWTLAHEQGIALPVKDYWEFDRLVT